MKAWSGCAAPRDNIDPSNPAANTVRAVIQKADEALQRRPGSVIDKSELPPSNDPRDYYHPAPYWWPNPDTPNGLPYVRRDGKRVPGTVIYESESDRYDRTRLQHLFDDGIALALAWAITGDERYAAHAGAWLRRWFINPESRMNPHLRFAQVRRGHNNDEGHCSGIIELKDFYYYLDAVRILERSRIVSESDISGFDIWLREYLDWLLTSPQGIAECRASNNHGIYYDLQVAAIAAYIEDEETLYRAFIRAKDRISVQFSPEGWQYHEMSRTQTAHYCCFNLQGWLSFARLAERYGERWAMCKTEQGAGIQAAIDWLSCHFEGDWPYQQIEFFDRDRFVPLVLMANSVGFRTGVSTEFARQKRRVIRDKPVFHPIDGIQPYWVLSMDTGRLEAVESASHTVSRAPSIQWKSLPDSRKASPTVPFVFAISLRAKTASKDWQRVTENLRATLATIFANQASNVEVVICGHDRPELGSETDSRITWIGASWDPPSEVQQYSSDKIRKRRKIGSYLRRKRFEGFFFAMDADDWVSSELVEYIRARPERAAIYVFDAGYMVNWMRGSARLRKTGFYRGCGSSSILYLRADDLPLDDSRESTRGLFFEYAASGHESIVDKAYAESVRVCLIDQPLIAWVLGHGENNSTRKGRNKEAFKATHSIHDDALKHIRPQSYTLSTGS